MERRIKLKEGGHCGPPSNLTNTRSTKKREKLNTEVIMHYDALYGKCKNLAPPAGFEPTTYLKFMTFVLRLSLSSLLVCRGSAMDHLAKGACLRILRSWWLGCQGPVSENILFLVLRTQKLSLYISNGQAPTAESRTESRKFENSNRKKESLKLQATWLLGYSALHPSTYSTMHHIHGTSWPRDSATLCCWLDVAKRVG